MAVDTSVPRRQGTAREPLRMEIIPSHALTQAQLDDIWVLTDAYIDTVRSTFEAKLRELPELALFRTTSGALVGMTSFEAYRVHHARRRRTVIFTSSVVIDERYRGQVILARLGARIFMREKRRHPFTPVDWLFDTFSYKSYLLLPRNFTEYWPRRDCATPPEVAAYIDALARDRYGEAWQPTRGIVARSGTKRLKPHTAPIDSRMLADPDIRFYDSLNPGHRDGDMLVCLCPLT